MARRNPYSKKAVAAKYGFRSGLEMTISESLKERGIDGEYEQHIIEYVKPETHHNITLTLNCLTAFLLKQRVDF